MPSSLTKALFTLLLCLLLPAHAQAESMTLTFDKSLQLTQLTAGATPTSSAQKAEQIVTLYPAAYSSKNGPIENIYDFEKKTFTVVNHTNKTYTVYPLQSVALSRARERQNRINTKIAMYQQHAENMQISLEVLSEDVDIDMMLGGKKSEKTSVKIKEQKEESKTTYIHGKNVLAITEPSAEAVPDTLRKSYAHFIVYDLPVHPMIKNALGNDAHVFKSIHFVNRDMFRNLSATYVWALKNAARGGGDAPAIPAEYERAYHQSAVINKAFKEALTPRTFDGEAFQVRTDKLIDQTHYLQAFLAAQVESLSTHQKDTAAPPAVLSKSLKAGQTFERAVYLSITQTPRNSAELKQYRDILENTKKRAPEYAWLMDYYIALHSRAVASKKATPNKFELQQIARANQTLLDTLQHSPHMFAIYQQAGDTHYAANETSTAMIYWAHAAEISPQSAGALAFAKMKSGAERDFPEYF